MEVEITDPNQEPQPSSLSDYSSDYPDATQSFASLEAVDAASLPAGAPPLNATQPIVDAQPTAAPRMETPDAVYTRPPARRRSFRPRVRPIHVKVHTFDTFRFRDYRFVWATTVFSSGGFWLQQVIIGWLTYNLTQSAFLTTVVMGLDALPILLVGPMGGLLADAWDRSRLLAFTFAYQCVTTVVFGLVVILGLLETWHIFVYILMMGMAFVILDPTRMSIIPSVVPRHNIVNAFALNSLGFSITRMAAPAIGGVVLALVGAGPALIMEAGLQLAAVGFALSIKLPPVEKTKLQLRSVFSQVMDGARYVKSEPVILGLILLGVLMPFLAFPFVNGLIPVYAAEVFDVDSVGLGLLMAAIGAGSVLGTLVLASFIDIKYKGRLVIIAIVLTGVSMIVFSRIPSIVIAFPMLMVISVGTMLFLSTASATIQTIVPDAFRGRVASLYALTFGTLPLGSLLAGSLAQRFSAPTATLTAGVVMLLALVVLMLRFRFIWRLR